MRRFVWFLWLGSGASVTYAADDGASGVAPRQNATGHEAVPTNEDADVQENPEKSETPQDRVRVKIPERLKDQGYRLRIDQATIDLQGDAVDFNDSGEFYGLQLIDRDGRVLDGDDGFVDEHMLSEMKPNRFRVGIHLGETIVRGDALQTILQDRTMNQQSLDFAWLPSAFGMTASLVGVGSLQDIDSGVTSSYSEAQARLGVVYELVPFKHDSGYASWFHLDLGAGALYSKSWIRIGDELVEIDDKSTGSGAYLEANVSFPVFDFWLDLRSFVSRNNLKFKVMDLETKLVRVGVLLGGSYAF